MCFFSSSAILTPRFSRSLFQYRFLGFEHSVESRILLCTISALEPVGVLSHTGLLDIINNMGYSTGQERGYNLFLANRTGRVDSGLDNTAAWRVHEGLWLSST